MATQPHTDILDSEAFGEGSRHYFIDLKRACNNRRYLRITRSDAQAEQSYKRSQVIVFENDLHFFVEALSMLLGRLAAGETGTN
jgi:DNA repair protein RadC